MRTIQAYGINESFVKTSNLFVTDGVIEDTRNGPACTIPGPLCIQINDPFQCYLSPELREVHPFFQFFEPLWVLSGEEDLKHIGQFVKNVYSYSDDGRTWRGAYGPRLRKYFGRDQIKLAIETLRNNPESRHAVLSIWDPATDGLGTVSKDHPCNDMIMFRAHKRGPFSYTLDMTVINRSNDSIWGFHLSNMPTFSLLLNYVAAELGMRVGRYFHISNNFHYYLNTPGLPEWYGKSRCPVDLDSIFNDFMPGIFSFDGFENDLQRLFNIGWGDINLKFESEYFNRVVRPAAQAWYVYNELHEPEVACNILRDVDDNFPGFFLTWLSKKCGATV